MLKAEQGKKEEIWKFSSLASHFHTILMDINIFFWIYFTMQNNTPGKLGGYICILAHPIFNYTRSSPANKQLFGFVGLKVIQKKSNN